MIYSNKLLLSSHCHRRTTTPTSL